MLKVEILAEEKDFIIINKPAGLVVHSDGRTNEYTLCDFLIEKFPEISGVGEALEIDGVKTDRPGIVHRLDRETSGVMVVARNQKSFEFLKKQFQDRRIVKTYHTFVYGNIREDTGVINDPIGRSPKDFRQWFSGKKARGEKREAVTEFHVLKRSGDKSVTFLEIHPKTGRTHQIRVHLKHIYHPIVGDSLYATDRSEKGNLLGFNRTALHALKIEFFNLSNKKISFTAPYPPDFTEAISQIGVTDLVI